MSKTLTSSQLHASEKAHITGTDLHEISRVVFPGRDRTEMGQGDLPPLKSYRLTAIGWSAKLTDNKPRLVDPGGRVGQGVIVFWKTPLPAGGPAG